MMDSEHTVIRGFVTIALQGCMFVSPQMQHPSVCLSTLSRARARSLKTISIVFPLCWKNKIRFGVKEKLGASTSSSISNIP